MDGLESIAARQLGLICRDQLLNLGYSRRLISYYAAIGRDISTVHPGVFRLTSAPITFEQSLLAAQFAASGSSRTYSPAVRAVVSHCSAGALFGFKGITSHLPELTIPHARRINLPGVVVHRTRNLEPLDVYSRGPLTLTTPARTLVDVAAGLEFAEIERVTHDALRRNIVTIPELRAAVRRRGKRR